MERIELAFLWHMHQPPYRIPDGGAYLLPWVRLHATRGYLDMARIHERFPEVRGTVNFSPILLEQLQDYAAGTARDRFLDLTACPAADLSEADRTLLLRTFFMVSWEQGVRPLPRYRELLHKRGLDLSYVDLVEVSRAFSERDLRDLQVLFNLAWMGFAARERDPTVQELLKKGRDFTEAEKASLLEAQRALVGEVIPAWKAIFEEGRVELSLTPYYHPILPLICDTDSAKIAMPETPVPPRLRARDDAEEHVRLALAKGRELFGRAPSGMWPAEGSVSPEVLEIFAKAGVRWAASDEEVLLRSLPQGTDRRAAVYRPWRVRAGAGELGMVFRDRGISDALGFVYARSPPSEAVSDFLGRLTDIAAQIPPGSLPEGELPLVSVILDGENPWEHYPNSGLDFLSELFSRLEKKEAGIATTAIGQRIERGLAPERVETIHSGSWIEANFRIWIGHPEEVEAWVLVGLAKEALREAEREGIPKQMLDDAHRHLLTAQASDWFWWYGEDFVTETKNDFDQLFRERIQAVFRAIGKPPPDASLEPIGAAGIRSGVDDAAHGPVGFIHPRLDGEVTSWQEWLGSGLFRSMDARGGSMHQAVGGDLSSLRYGFDASSFYLRVDLGSDDSAQGSTQIEELRIDLRAGEREIELQTKLTSGPLLIYNAEEQVELGAGAFGSVIEISLPFEDLEFQPGQRVRFLVRGMKGAVEVERLPSSGWLAFDVPDESFEQRTWKV